MAVTSPASTFCQPTRTTLAAFTIASAASIMPTRPRVSTRPSASPGRSFAIRTLILSDSPARRHRQRRHDAVTIDQPYLIDQVRHDARMIRDDADERTDR